MGGTAARFPIRESPCFPRDAMIRTPDAGHARQIRRHFDLLAGVRPMLVSSLRLQLAGWFFVAVGLGLAVPALFAPSLLDSVYDVVRTGTPIAAPLDASARFGAALAGALTLGWGWCIVMVGAGRPFATALRHGVLAWFVVDSAASLLLGFGGNAVSNLGFVLVTWWATRAVAERRTADPSPSV
jgi:hypothetical protein